VNDAPATDPRTTAELAVLGAEGMARTVASDDAAALTLVGCRVGQIRFASAVPRATDGRLIFHAQHVGTGQVEHLLSRQVLAIHDRADLNGSVVVRVKADSPGSAR
jgi:hypothetical protein